MGCRNNILQVQWVRLFYTLFTLSPWTGNQASAPAQANTEQFYVAAKARFASTSRASVYISVFKHEAAGTAFDYWKAT